MTASEISIGVCFGVVILGLFFYIFQNKHQQAYLNSQQRKILSQERMIHKLISAQDHERNQIATELHDKISSKLNVIFLQLNQIILKETVSVIPLEEVRSILNETIINSCNMSHQLFPAELESLGLGPAIESICDFFQHHGSKKIDTIIDGKRPTGIRPILEVHIFRILQISIKHAFAYNEIETISVHLIQREDQISLNYQIHLPHYTLKKDQELIPLEHIKTRINIINGTYQLKQVDEIVWGINLEVDIIKPHNLS